MAELIGEPPVGWFCGRPSVNTRRLLVEQGGYLYDRDYLGDELPFRVEVGGCRHLIVPYTRSKRTTTGSTRTADSAPRTTLSVAWSRVSSSKHDLNMFFCGPPAWT
jgi:hypothetical protein